MFNIKDVLLVFVVSVFFGVFLCLISPAEAQISWDDEKAYKPAPILFLHGFGPGEADSWGEAIELLQPYFDAYNKGIEYIKAIDFVHRGCRDDEYVNRNSSIDTYQDGDYYVKQGSRIAGVSPGWSDIVDESVKEVADDVSCVLNPPSNVTLVAHSMGGLAAREFLTNVKYGELRRFVDTLITVGTPHLGSPLALYARGIGRSQMFGWFYMPVFFVTTLFSDAVEEELSFLDYIDVNGDAVRDMNPSSDFLRCLSKRAIPEELRNLLIFGRLKGFENILLLEAGGGDGVVGENSQRGIITKRAQEVGRAFPLEEDTKFCASELEVRASHHEEIRVSCSGEEPLLKLIDYKVPDLEITYPEEGQVITEKDGLHIKGEVRQEVFPADCEVEITCKNLSDIQGRAVNVSSGKLLEATDLWSPYEESAPVAVLNQKLSDFLTTGNEYEITVMVKNPAGAFVKKSVAVKIDIPEEDTLKKLVEMWESAETGMKEPHVDLLADSGVWQVTNYCAFMQNASLFSVESEFGNKSLKMVSLTVVSNDPETGDIVGRATGVTKAFKEDMSIAMSPFTQFEIRVGGEISLPYELPNDLTIGPAIYAAIHFSDRRVLKYVFLCGERFYSPEEMEYPGYFRTVFLNRLGDFKFNLWDDYNSYFNKSPEGVSVTKCSLECINHISEKVIGPKYTTAIWDNIYIGD